MNSLLLTFSSLVRLLYASEEKMKRLLLILSLFFCTLAWAGKPAKVQNLINQYKDRDGFEAVSVGRLGLSLARGLALFDGADSEDLQLLRAFKKIRHITILSFDDADEAVKERFVRKVGRILDGMDLILESKDDGDRLSIYGIDDGEQVRDCILFSPDGLLICVRGSLNLDQLLALADD